MQEHGYPIPAGLHRVESVVDRSRFIATLAQAGAPEDARAVIDAVRHDFADATHNCWAYVCGPPGSTAAIGMSDAGEPHGTAGRPMLDVLLHSGVGDVVAVVTRYFGGVKLGRGGLVRAYGGAVQHGLASLPRTRRIERLGLAVTLGYADLEAFRRLLHDEGVEVVDERYEDVVHYRLAVPAARVAEFERRVADHSAGRAHIKRTSAH
ncbi:MAG TPA: YigZ family protein [Longimicrobiales bacterium]|nr:YigZ family protein [Longimicrobiales bacterium]